MDDQERVLARYPNAVAKEEFPTPEPGQEAGYAVGFCVIFDQPGPGAAEIGRGESEAEAWADAESRLGKGKAAKS
jgi:hypothetical protein